jgi:NADPH:quinone reductase-like Zn-dependent oxidoreductase
MKALQFFRYGGPDVLEFDDVPVPEPGVGEVLVRVAGSGINPVDGKIREGKMKAAYRIDFPHVVGREFSGTIEKVGNGVSGYNVGDDVYGIEAHGTCAEYIVSKPETFSLAPATMELPDSGAVPLAAMTAWQGLFDHGGLKDGQKVLIQAGSGGVGTFAIQLAKWAGAYVYTTVGKDRFHMARELGADRPIDYEGEKFDEIAKDVDVVFDLLGGEIGKRSLACLKPGGILVSTVHDAPEEDAKAQGKRAANMTMQPSPEQLQKLSALIQDLEVRPVIDAVVPFREAVEAHKQVESGHTVGKIVIDVRR